MRSEVWKGVRWIPPIVALLIAVWLMVEAARGSAYAAPYTLVGAILLAAMVLAAGLVLLIPRRTRRLGRSLALAAVILCSTVWISMGVMDRVGVWEEEWVPIQPPGPATVVVLFATDTDPREILWFVENVVGEPRARGHANLPGMRGLVHVCVGGHEGYAVYMSESATAAETENLRRRATESPLAWKVFEDVSPDEIVIESPPEEDP